jgi:hypothetical protein
MLVLCWNVCINSASSTQYLLSATTNNICLLLATYDHVEKKISQDINPTLWLSGKDNQELDEKPSLGLIVPRSSRLHDVGIMQPVSFNWTVHFSYNHNSGKR